ncbi:MAG: zinc metallopeptidase [Firmicutes bacterium]|nr:zinc metallopeptidase [Bacillota bacterium]
MDLLLILVMILIPLIADLNVKRTYKKYLGVKNTDGLTGQEVARKILDKNGLENVYVVETSGYLSDHYDPKRKTVRLSKAVFEGETVASIAIAAHECGHAIQDKEGYLYMKVRSAIFPIVNIATSISYYILLIGFLLQILDLVYLGIAFTALGLIFQIVTLPVEFNASARAQKELEALHLVKKEEETGVKKVLKSAALTYVAGVLASAAQIIRLILVARNND